MEEARGRLTRRGVQGRWSFNKMRIQNVCLACKPGARFLGAGLVLLSRPCVSSSRMFTSSCYWTKALFSEDLNVASSGTNNARL